MNGRISKITILFVILALATPMFLSNNVQKANAGGLVPTFCLTILHNNDGESELVNLGGNRADFGGAARFKTLVDMLKAEAYDGEPYIEGTKQGMLMLSSGDNFLAGPEFNASLEKGIPFYDTIVMDKIGFDAVAIGNHDFDFGPDVLADFIIGYEETQPSYLSANLIFTGEPRLQELFDEGRIARSMIVEENGEMIGIVGAVTPRLRFISSPRNVEVLDDVASAIMVEVQKLRRMKVNKIILISHLQSILEDLELAPRLFNIDVMIAGGGDELLANPEDLIIPGDTIYGPYPMYASDRYGKQIPVITTAGSYAYVGRLEVCFNQRGDVEVINEASGPVRVAGGDNPDAVEPDPVIQELVVDPILEYTANLAATVIGTSEVALEGRRPDIRVVETNEGNLVADSLFWQADQLAASFGVPAPDVALQNGGGIRNNSLIPAGEITELTTFDILPFPNFVSTVEGISREQFKEILENAVSRVEFVDGRFAQISGFSYSWNPSGTPQELDADFNVTVPGTRVVDVTLNDGTEIVVDGVVQPGDALTIATIDFLARGGDQYPFRGAPFTTLGVTYQQALSNYIQDGLGGLISAEDYPEGGEGRITEVGAVPTVAAVGSLFTGQTVFMPLTTANW